MVKTLTFKGDPKPHKKKRKREDAPSANNDQSSSNLNLTSNIDDPKEVQDDENWVSADMTADISGPIMLVLPTVPVTCIAVDQLGSIFPSRVENMVEGSPGTAEPHDVRQVWIATRIVGTDDHFTFKGHHGKYMGCDTHGFLSATREAVSAEETFVCVPSLDMPGQFDLRTGRAQFLCADTGKTPVGVRGDAEAADESTALRIRMQARFKPQHKIEKAEKVRAKISRKELEAEAGRRLDDDEVKTLKKARRQGNYHEVMLDVKVKGKHDAFA